MREWVRLEIPAIPDTRHSLTGKQKGIRLLQSLRAMKKNGKVYLLFVQSFSVCLFWRFSNGIRTKRKFVSDRQHPMFNAETFFFSSLLLALLRWGKLTNFFWPYVSEERESSPLGRKKKTQKTSGMNLSVFCVRTSNKKVASFSFLFHHIFFFVLAIIARFCTLVSLAQKKKKKPFKNKKKWWCLRGRNAHRNQ